MILYLTKDEHELLNEMLSGEIVVDTLSINELVALSNLRVKSGLPAIPGIEELK